MKTKTPATVVTPLPEGIRETDLKVPSFKGKDRLVSHDVTDPYMTLYHTARFGWVIATLQIARARRGSGMTDRTYAIALDGTLCRVGRGPHVTREIMVYVRESRLTALKKFIDLRQKGSISAHECRDQISSRRARGALRRSTGFGW